MILWGGGQGKREGEMRWWEGEKRGRTEREGRKKGGGGEAYPPCPPPHQSSTCIHCMQFSHEFVNSILLLPQDRKKYKCIIKCTGNYTGKQPNISADQLSTHIVFLVNLSFNFMFWYTYLLTSANSNIKICIRGVMIQEKRIAIYCDIFSLFCDALFS